MFLQNKENKFWMLPPLLFSLANRNNVVEQNNTNEKQTKIIHHWLISFLCSNANGKLW